MRQVLKITNTGSLFYRHCEQGRLPHTKPASTDFGDKHSDSGEYEYYGITGCDAV